MISDRVQYSWELRELGLLRCEVESLRPPRSGEVLCCLAWILGESRDSGFRLGLDARADNGISLVHPERLEGNLETPSPFQDQGLIMGDSCVGCVSLFRIGA